MHRKVDFGWASSTTRGGAREANLSPLGAREDHMNSPLALPTASLSKAKIYMRALRRAVLAYWYATIEDREAALIECATATFFVNILDEAVFETAHDHVYRQRRAGDRLGRVVMGLELVRNCETHAPVAFEDLLVARRWIGVPLSHLGQLMRSVFAWAAWDHLPIGYRELNPTQQGGRQLRARKEAQDAYRKAVQTRDVIETLFDAIAFFQHLDDRLVTDHAPGQRWAFAHILPGSDPEQTLSGEYYLARPMSVDRWEIFLPDMACRAAERRSARWEASDTALEAKVKRLKRQPPRGDAREVCYSVLDPSDCVVGYSGYTTVTGGHRTYWIERHQQVWKDVRAGHRYFVSNDHLNLDLRDVGHNQLAAAKDDGTDALLNLPVAPEGPLGYEGLKMTEEYDDLYVRMRLAT